MAGYLVENKYIDKDYSADHQAFYGQLFKIYPKYCKRLLFFGKGIAQVFAVSSWLERAIKLELTPFLGFAVVKPLPRSPLGRTVLKPLESERSDTDLCATARATYAVNALGARLEVTGAAFIQQDSRVSSCAQAALWVAGRQMHARHGYPWYSVADITRLASSPTDELLSSQLPAGSDHLTLDNMARACRAMGFQPLCFEVEKHRRVPIDTIVQYADSGLPVILGVDTNTSIGHAVVVVGFIFKKVKKLTSQSGAPRTFAEFVRGVVVHDDQQGPYRIIPLTAADARDPSFDRANLITKIKNGKSCPLTIEDDVLNFLVPMPTRVFSKSDIACLLAIESAEQLMDGIEANRSSFADLRENIAVSELLNARRLNRLVTRTYLTSAGKYRYHLAKSRAAEVLKDKLMVAHLPHFIWVTEIGTIDSFNHASSAMRRIYGHVIVDATSSAQEGSAVLAIHLPGVVKLQSVDKADDSASGVALFPISNDVSYEARVKGGDEKRAS